MVNYQYTTIISVLSELSSLSSAAFAFIRRMIVIRSIKIPDYVIKVKV